MDIVKRLPTELQNIIKYYVLESPFKQQLKEHKYTIYQLRRVCCSCRLYKEILLWKNGFTDRNGQMVIDLYEFYTSYNIVLKFNFLTYFNLNMLENYSGIFTREHLYKRLKSLTNAKQREILTDVTTQKQKVFSRLKKDELIRATYFHENATD